MAFSGNSRWFFYDLSIAVRGFPLETPGGKSPRYKSWSSQRTIGRTNPGNSKPPGDCSPTRQLISGTYSTLQDASARNPKNILSLSRYAAPSAR